MPGLTDDLTRQLRTRPLLIVGGGVGLLVAAQLLSRSRDAEIPPEPDGDPAATDPGAQLATDPGLIPDSGLGYTGGGGSFDPITFDPDTGSSEPEVQYTPDGCPLPRPTVPAEYVGKGTYECDGIAGAWVWIPKPPDLTPDGCPLPKPTIPTDYIGRGDWQCVSRAWKWVPVSAPPPAPPPAGGGGGYGQLVVPRGTYRIWREAVAGGRASGADTWTVDATVTRRTTAQIKNVTLPDGTKVAAMVRLKDGGKAGWYVNVRVGTWTWKAG